MLTPSYLLHAVEPAEEIAEQLHSDILKRIIDRILLRLDRGDGYILTAVDKYQLETLQQAGYLLEDIQKEIAKATGLMRTEIKEAMEDAGVQALSYDDAVYRAAGLDPLPLIQSPYLIQLMQDTYEQTLGEWTNFTSTTANAVQQTFIKLCDQAYMQVMSGSMGWTQATREAVEGLISEGVRITYPSGHSDTIETAAARCVRTGISQASARITDARMEEMDWDIIIVSAHLGARVADKDDYTNHSWWQGKFYSKSGKDERFPLFSVCGMGNVQGIHGANCRHSHGPGDGEHNPFTQYDSEENRKQYEAEQKQRAMERRIRKSKREVMGYREAMENAQTDETKAAFEAKYQKKAALLQEQNKAYNQYCEDTGLKKQSDRISIAKWDRSQAAKATAAARKYNEGFSEKTSSKVFTNQNLPDIMNTRAGDEKMTINSIEKPIEQKHTGKGNPNAILHFDVELTKRQAAILDNLPDYNSRTVVTKSNVNMADLSALTAKTGDEFALFTKSGERLIVRGNPYMVDITPEEAHRMGLDGYIWSGHTHPGVDFNALQPSTGDYAILNQFRQESSAIYNSTGQYLIFERTEPYV